MIDRVGTWDESEVACQSIGMHLAVIQDEVTHEALHTYLSSLETLVYVLKFESQYSIIRNFQSFEIVKRSGGRKQL